ncbi:protein-S-isoprenylcysteine O-methyltransferase-like protein [Dinothrombium tinctorium]|uniref:Protein-S-isoprenylcysteine O-methyltransferase n=1 Tax=Dinothrombium tinctorium TaxID=1965070 RepID=A0A443RLT2_9ACAR|nr:protein-S-isoprenylcysteine O-methyltransferase-like protein [Dinothrombium tinctorium]
MVLSMNGRIALTCFALSTLLSFSLLPLSASSEWLNKLFREHWFYATILFSLLLQLFIANVYKRTDYVYKIAWRATLLASGFTLGLFISFLASNSWKVFGWYLSVLCFFHCSEYITVSIVNPKSLSLNSFLLNHSREYAMAAFLSWTEFVVERYFFPNLKQIWWLSVIGLLLCSFGEIIRKLAMITAGTNFNHVIQSYREEGHVLVTHGIYSIFRHPAYVGWLYWSIGTQVILVNPICTLGYAIASWLFFKKRIESEEISLLNFFGEDYVAYQRRVKTGIPFVSGYSIER